MPIDDRLVKWDDAPDTTGIDTRMVKWDKVKKPDKMDATEGMSTGEKFLAGVGKSIHDAGQGIGQMLGLTSRDDVAESRRLDADLMKTSAGKVGDFAGNVATTVPLAFVPGANTVKGASLIGSLTGLMQPSTSTQETATNAGLGGVIGGGSVMAGRGLAAAYQGATGLLRPLTGKGQRDIAAEVLQASATNPEKAIASAASARPLVAGSNPTMAQVANDPGLAQLERTLLNKPESAGPLAQRYAEQQAARKATIAEVAGTPEHRAAIEEGRQIFANEDYAKAMAGGINEDAAKLLAPRIDSIMQRPSIQSAKMIAKNLAAEKDIALNDFASVQGMDWIKKALDNQISKAQAGGSSIGKEKLSGLVQTKNDLMSVIEQLSPAYKEANDNFAKMSKQINAADVAADLQKRLYKNAEWGSGKEMGSTYQGALSDALESVKKQTGMNKSLSDVMSPGDLSKLEGIARDLSRKEAGQTLGRAVGSPTMQNMMGQNLIDRIAGPLGAPQSFSQNVIANTLSRPYNFVMQSAEPRILGLLSEAVADPKKAAELLSMVKQPTKMGKLATNAEKFLSVPGLLALENR